jgi:hypothetical protein
MNTGKVNTDRKRPEKSASGQPLNNPARLSGAIIQLQRIIMSSLIKRTALIPACHMTYRLHTAMTAISDSASGLFTPVITSCMFTAWTKSITPLSVSFHGLTGLPVFASTQRTMSGGGTLVKPRGLEMLSLNCSQTSILGIGVTFQVLLPSTPVR